jgi:nucleoside-diphosphate-sugar epimerase
LELVTADLLSDDGWEEATRGCQYVLHVASPTSAPKDENEVIKPARDGTLRVLKAATNTGAQRVVLTSSMAAVASGHDPTGRVFTEDDWANIDGKIDAYGKSKALAERAAWNFINQLPAGQGPELVSINPSYVLGPQLDEDGSISLEIVGKLMRREVPGCARLGFSLVDVRDVATAHLAGMTAPQAAGKRFLCSAEFYWFQDIALVLQKHLAGRGYRIPTRALPDILVRLFAFTDEEIRRLVPSLGLRFEASSERLRSTLEWQPRPVPETIIDTAESLIEWKLA